MSNDQFPMNAQDAMLNAEAVVASARVMDCDGKRSTPRLSSLTLHRMRGEGWGEG